MITSLLILQLICLALVVALAIDQATVNKQYKRFVNDVIFHGNFPLVSRELDRVPNGRALSETYELLHALTEKELGAEMVSSILNRNAYLNAAHGLLMAYDEFRASYATMSKRAQDEFFEEDVEYIMGLKKLAEGGGRGTSRPYAKTPEVVQLADQLATLERDIHENWKEGRDTRPQWRKDRTQWRLDPIYLKRIVQHRDQRNIEAIRSMTAEEYIQYYNREYFTLFGIWYKDDLVDALRNRYENNVFPESVWARVAACFREKPPAILLSESVRDRIRTARLSELGLKPQAPNVGISGFLRKILGALQGTKK